MTDNFRQECKNMAYKNRLGKIELEDDVISNSDYLSNIEIIDSCISGNEIIGNANSKSIKFNTIGSQYELINKRVDAFIGVKYDDSSEEYVPMGKLLITNETNDILAKTGEYSGVNCLTNIDDAYNCSLTDITTATIADFYIDVTEQLGLTPKNIEFINSDLLIGGNPFTNNETRKTVLQNIAQVACSFIEIDLETMEIDLCWLDDEVSETFDKKDYSELEKNQKIGPINCVVIKESQIEGENVVRQDDESIEKDGECQISIEDNYFLYTEDLRTQAIDKIFDRLKGLTYFDCKLTSYTGKPYLKRGNKISIQDEDESYFDTYVLSHTFTYDGTFKSVIESPALKSSSTAIKNTQTITGKLRRVERIANKIDGLVSDIVETVETFQNETNNQMEQLVNSVQETIDSTSEKIEVIEKRVVGGVESLKNSLVTIDINGISVSTNLSAISTLITNDTFAIKSGDTYLAYFGYDNETKQTKAEMDNLTVTNYLVTGYHRIEKFEPDYEKRTGVFYIGGSY